MDEIKPWTGQKVRLVTFAWGKPYIDRLLQQALAAALAPGNLPMLAKHFDCTVVVVTEESLFDYVINHPIGKKIQSFCPLKLVSLDDLIAEPWQYGITLAYALYRGFSDLGEEMTDTFILFLNADFILADGSYERLIPYMLAGHRVLLSPSYCTNEEDVYPLLVANAAVNDDAISIPPREMASIIIAHRHNTIIGKTLNQVDFHFKYSDQFYWMKDESTLLGFQMPIALVAIRPEIALNDLTCFWDWGVVYDFCPSKKMTVLGDSDDFLILELREKLTHIDKLVSGPGSPRIKARNMEGYITQYQYDNAKFPLLLHAEDLPSGIDIARESLEVARDKILSYVSNKPHHSLHPQWVYHQHYLRFWQETKQRRINIEIIKKKIDEIEEKIKLEDIRSNLINELKDLSSLQTRDSNAIVDKYAVWLHAPKSLNLLAILNPQKTVFGEYVFAKPTSVLWSLYYQFAKLVKEVAINSRGPILVLADDKAISYLISRIIESQLVDCTIKTYEVNDLFKPSQIPIKGYSDCIVYVIKKEVEVRHFEEILLAVKKVIRPTGNILFHMNQIEGRLSDWSANLVTRTNLLTSQSDIRVSGKTWLTNAILISFHILDQTRTSPRRKKILRRLLLISFAPIAVLANLLELFKFKKNLNGRSFTALIPNEKIN